MKYILLIAIAFTLSCSKDKTSDANTTCYHCKLGNSPNGQPNADRDTCIPAWEAVPQFTDANNNNLNSSCTKK